MSTSDRRWDRTLEIKTTGRDSYDSDQHRFAYEASPYIVLERLADSGLIGENDLVLDYGCGKGRVGFFLSYKTKAKSIGIEYTERIYGAAVRNLSTAISADGVSFLMENAEDYQVPTKVNRCYFFNPFSVEILENVMAKIIESYYLKPREILLFFYYPSEEYISYLMTVDEIEYMDEIDCKDLFIKENWREQIIIYRFLI